MPETKRTDAPKPRRSLSTRAGRSLKDADRLLQKEGGEPSKERAMASLEQARVLALLDIAQTIRDGQKS